jgi:hypothetical protein
MSILLFQFSLCWAYFPARGGRDERIAIFGMIINYDQIIKRRSMQLICNRHHALLIAMVIAVVALFLSGTGWAVDASPKDNAYHYMANGVDDQLYNEWWYFDVADNDTMFQVVYLLSDPDNISSERKIQVQAVVMQDGEPHLIGQHHSRGYGGDRNSSIPLDGFYLAFAEILSEQRVAFIGIEKDGKSIVFSDKQIKLNYSNAFDNMTAAVFPAAYNVEADNGD